MLPGLPVFSWGGLCPPLTTMENTSSSWALSATWCFMSSVRLLWWHVPVTTAGTCHQCVQFKGSFHSLFPNTHGKSLSFFSMFISVCYKSMLTNKKLTQRGLPFSSRWEAWKHEKCRKSGWKTKKIWGFFKAFNFVVFLGCFKATWGSLEVSLACPEASWRRLGTS